MANNRAQDVEIRPARDGDIYELSQLRLEALRTEPIAFSRNYEADSRQSPEDWAAWFHERSDGANGAIFVADAAGKLAGMAGMARSGRPSCATTASCGASMCSLATAGVGPAGGCPKRVCNGRKNRASKSFAWT